MASIDQHLHEDDSKQNRELNGSVGTSQADILHGHCSGHLVRKFAIQVVGMPKAFPVVPDSSPFNLPRSIANNTTKSNKRKQKTTKTLNLKKKKNQKPQKTKKTTKH